MTGASGYRHHLGLIPDDVIDRLVEVGDGRLRTDVPCCEMGLELDDEPGVVGQAVCPRCQLAYTVELVVVGGKRWARFTLVGPIAIASPRRPAPAEGLGWHPVGQRTHLVTIDNAVIGVITRDAAEDVFTARRCGASDKLAKTFGTVESAALALGDAVHMGLGWRAH